MSGKYRKTLVVIPALNEELSISEVVDDVYEFIPGATCLVVDDGSLDSTYEVAKRSGALVAKLPFNLGVGGAMRLGFNFALDKGFTSVIQVDADGQHDPRQARLLLDALTKSDVVIGARFAGTGDYRAKGPRKWAMNLLAATLSRTSGVTLTDTTSGFRASGQRAIAFFAQHYPSEYLGDTVESLVLASRAGLTIRQIPVTMNERKFGEPSHGPVKSALYLARVGIAVLFSYLRPATRLEPETKR
jgi:glycosyltransferase involved in cell wall biosynthesis